MLVECAASTNLTAFVMASGTMQLAHSDAAVPLSVLATASLAGMDLAAKVDPKLERGAQPVLTLPQRCERPD
jgi:hypothetical protein